MTIIREQTLYYTSGTSDKAYRLTIAHDAAMDTYTVAAYHGRRSSCTTLGRKETVACVGDANNLFEAIFREKARKGYTTDISGRPRGPALLGSRASAPGAARPWNDFLRPPEAEAEAMFEQALESPLKVVQWVQAAVKRVWVQVQVHPGRLEPDVLSPEVTREILSVFAPKDVLEGYLSEGCLFLTDVAGSNSRLSMAAEHPLAERLERTHALLAWANCEHIQVCPWAWERQDKAELAATLGCEPGERAWLVRDNTAYQLNSRSGARPVLV